MGSNPSPLKKLKIKKMRIGIIPTLTIADIAPTGGGDNRTHRR
jgi:hypothetical protein